MGIDEGIGVLVPANDMDPTENHANETEPERVIQLLRGGSIEKALKLINSILIGNDFASNQEANPKSLDLSSDQFSLLEKRCLINMKLQNYENVLNDARLLLEKQVDHSLAYKCLLVALCKTLQFESVPEVLKLWKSSAPNNLEMLQTRTTIEGLLLAIKNGIESSEAFLDIEDQLGLSFDYLIAKKPVNPGWSFRPLPPGKQTFNLCLPFRFGHCPLGEKCPDAHGQQELEEWKSRRALKSVTSLLDNIKLDKSDFYIKNLLNNIEMHHEELSETLPDGVKIRCSKSFEICIPLGFNHKWMFDVESRTPLTHICLLEQIHRKYFSIVSAVIIGRRCKFDLLHDRKSKTTQVVDLNCESNPAALDILANKSKVITYKFEVVFKPGTALYGNFCQTVLFDNGGKPKFIKKLSVNVVPKSELDKQDDVESDLSVIDCSEKYLHRTSGTWNFGNAEILDGSTGEKVSASKLGFALLGSISKPWDSENNHDSLSRENYKEQMRYFLTQEEKARQEILAKYNLTTNVALLEHYVMTSGYNDGLTRYALDGSLYGKMTLFRDISEDTAVGRLILKSCNYVLIAKTENVKHSISENPTVFLCLISDKTKNDIYLEIGPACVEKLGLKQGVSMSFDIQFQLDRTSFSEMKQINDKLEDHHLGMLFPTLNKTVFIPWTPLKQWGKEDCDDSSKLNPRQREALIAITSETVTPPPPILVIGPFGTGKTFTLAQCIRKLLATANTRVMVCTHSNSAADLYIKEYLDPWVKEGYKEATPLRIYYQLRNLNSVHPDVLEYCIIEKSRFRSPTVQEILSHRIIVVTLSTSYMLMQLNLPKDCFSHILLDEAAQAMECEAITPIIFASEKTKIVLAGDHMQLSPELFSSEAKQFHPSLLERLHNAYPNNHPCKLMLCENYRSHSSIIQFVSNVFYKDKLKCSKTQPVHDKFYPLTFFSARGEEVHERDSTSYFNMAEVFEIADKVSKLISSWPKDWGSYRHESSIGVLTPYADQVSKIRSALRKKGLYSVSVERVLNVQGKQFRAVFLSTVRSFRPWVKILPEAVGNEVDMGFFSNPKLLNTALTRAQSLVAVVGDPVSLCSEGKCRNLWNDFLAICHKNKSLYGISYTQLEQDILGLEMRTTWGLNPLANEFEPQIVISNSCAVSQSSELNQANPSGPTSDSGPFANLPISQTQSMQVSQAYRSYIPGSPVMSYHSPVPSAYNMPFNVTQRSQGLIPSVAPIHPYPSHSYQGHPLHSSSYGFPNPPVRPMARVPRSHPHLAGARFPQLFATGAPLVTLRPEHPYHASHPLQRLPNGVPLAYIPPHAVAVRGLLPAPTSLVNHQNFPRTPSTMQNIGPQKEPFIAHSGSILKYSGSEKYISPQANPLHQVPSKQDTSQFSCSASAAAQTHGFSKQDLETVNKMIENSLDGEARRTLLKIRDALTLTSATHMSDMRKEKLPLLDTSSTGIAPNQSLSHNLSQDLWKVNDTFSSIAVSNPVSSPVWNQKIPANVYCNGFAGSDIEFKKSNLTHSGKHAVLGTPSNATLNKPNFPNTLACSLGFSGSNVNIGNSQLVNSQCTDRSEGQVRNMGQIFQRSYANAVKFSGNTVNQNQLADRNSASESPSDQQGGVSHNTKFMPHQQI